MTVSPTAMLLTASVQANTSPSRRCSQLGPIQNTAGHVARVARCTRNQCSTRPAETARCRRLSNCWRSGTPLPPTPMLS